MSQESEQAQEAWIAHFNKRYNEHSLPCTGSAAVGMVDYKAALKVEIEKRIDDNGLNRNQNAFQFSIEELAVKEELRWFLSLLDTVKPL